jgi:toxin-antitoxin system PIN domain toxin
VTPDVNVVVAASRSDHPHHQRALSWLQRALEECRTGGSFQLLPMVATAFLRLVTNPKVFPQPTPLADALDFLEAIMQVPGAEMPELGREWKAFTQLCRAGPGRAVFTGNRIPDAWIAAAVISGGYHLVTFDRGFSDLLAPGARTILAP